MQSSRLPRFTRASAVATIELTERDREIVRLVERFRFVRSSHICSLIPGSAQQLLRRLKLLYHHGFLERPRAQLDYYHRAGSRHIDRKSTRLNSSHLGISYAVFCLKK